MKTGHSVFSQRLDPYGVAERIPSNGRVFGPTAGSAERWQIRGSQVFSRACRAPNESKDTKEITSKEIASKMYRFMSSVLYANNAH
jgi:hypothetical protein